MKLINNRRNVWVVIYSLILLFNCAGHSVNGESWIETKDLFNVRHNMTSDEIIQKLGEPLFVESFNDIDEEVVTTIFYYNFRTKEYSKDMLEKGNVNAESVENVWGRTTRVQFQFIDDHLISWEEDKLILSMAKEEQGQKGSILQYLSLLLNLILIVKVF